MNLRFVLLCVTLYATSSLYSQDLIIECPENLLLECDEFNGNYTPPEIISSCGETEMTFQQTDSGDSCEFFIEITWVVTDECDNGATCTQVITLLDITEPQITDMLDYPDGINIDDFAIGIAVEDNCNEFTISYDFIFTEDETEVQVAYSVTDACGNQFVTLSDPWGYFYAGCTDENACNYDPNAAESDGSCLYPDDICFTNGLGEDFIYDNDCNCGASFPGDYDNDNLYTITDLVEYSVHFGQAAVAGTPAELSDLNGDGLINIADFLEFLESYGQSTPY